MNCPSGGPLHTIWGVITKLKDAIPDSDKSGVVYGTGCKDCGETYIGEMVRNLHTRLDEQKRVMRLGNTGQSAIARHHIQTGHQLDRGGTHVLDVMPNKHQR